MMPWLLDMWWHDVCFMHWRADAEIVARALPPGITLDRFEGDAWLSVVPFCLSEVRARFGPTLPGFARVPELNLRTYVSMGGRSGVWFFSLDAASRIAVESARVLTALPYFNARIVTNELDGTIAYSSARTDARAAAAGSFDARYTPYGDIRHAARASLDAFLHERYRFFSQRGTKLLTARIRHESWPLQGVATTIETNTLGDLIGHPLAPMPDYATFARSLHVQATTTANAISDK
jgi:uncharacterized protein YqjF (DUF2071 family)